MKVWLGAIIASFLLVAFSIPLYAQVHEWTTLDGPYWSQGIDVACGNLDDDYYRYLIGENATSQKVFYWRETSDSKWDYTSDISTADKIISYNAVMGTEDAGHIAFCLKNGAGIYRTTDGGVNWDGLPVAPDNDDYSALEVDGSDSEGDLVYVGCGGEVNEASVFSVEYDNGQWQVDEVGDDGLTEKDVSDLEFTFHASGYLIAATDDGIYGIIPSPTNSWDQWAFPGIQVTAIEALNYHDELFAAISTASGKLLYFAEDPTDTYTKIYTSTEPSPTTEFNKDVKDMSAIHIFDDLDDEFISLYVAGDDGLYFLDFEQQNGQLEFREYVDFQTDTEYFTDSPFRYDRKVKSVDYYQESRTSLTREILVGTEYNVYLITETRRSSDRSIEAITIADLTAGTFIADVKGLSMPDNSSSGRKIFTVTEEGLIKEHEDDTWKFIGTAFELDDEGMTGTDIATDFTGQNDYILASSNGTSEGKVMYSSDGGSTWTKKSLSAIGDPKVSNLDYSLVSNKAYAAGIISYVWKSTDNGDEWSLTGGIYGTIIKDVFSDPDQNRDNFAYAGGYSATSARAYIYNGSSWSSMNNDLPSGSVNQFAKGGTINWIYAATNAGVYKASLNAAPITWSSRTNGIGTPYLGSIVADKNNPYGFLTSTAPGVTPPQVWASGDSGRSWIELPLGDIPTSASINRLASSEDENSGFIVGTDKGVFALANTFRAGDIYTSEQWGPGVVILTGDVGIFHNITVTIKSPCTIYAPYEFDSYGHDDMTYIHIYSSGTLETDNQGGGEIYFTSSRPSNPQPGDWQGIDVAGGGDLQLSKCVIEYAEEAIVAGTGATLSIHECEINDPEISGITAISPDNFSVWSTSFNNNTLYSISVEGHQSEVVHISETSIGGEFIDGIKYFGTSADHKVPTIENVDIINEGSPEGTGILISDNQYGAPQGEISYTKVTGMDCGIYITGSEDPVKVGPEVHSYHNDWAGIVVENAVANIEGVEGEQNAFIENEVGITGVKNYGKVRWTDLGDNDMGGDIYECYMDFGNEEQEDSGMNSFEGDQSMFLNIINEGSAEYVYAQLNWWGTTNLEEIYEKVTEWVIVEPILYSYPFAKLSPLSANLPDRLRILSAYPNPFNAEVTIEFSLSRSAQVSLKVYNILGQEISEVYRGYADAGTGYAVWDGRDHSGEITASGIYFCIVRADDQKDIKKLMLLK